MSSERISTTNAGETFRQSFSASGVPSGNDSVYPAMSSSGAVIPSGGSDANTLPWVVR